ncbi:DUF5024 domain-containing protein [Parabacteroides sp. 52]|uniref:DUF5024 domain-containing protein n=1 Tax=unclassified Parabacteroides TaxID=2649774 RepID=UPI0013D17CCC|nr:MULTISPECIES: DUF5024 domain-containing protein [unclassified Parabacteroides]MDH6534433.1 hypothetical protein [Parabacteroides sp. PM5-20]NDV55118.1 DUF5024 domain-containing protein [Parabacteroides sp. 52]
MKTKHFLLIALLLITGSVCSEIYGQTHIKALVKKCETMDNVELSRVRDRDPAKNRQRTVTSIMFKNNEELLDLFIEAAKKDEADATQIIESKVNGKMVPSFYRFGNTSFSISQKKDGNAVSISFIEN